MTSNSPIRIPVSAITNARIKALTGSLFFPFPLPNNLGVTLSKDIACKILGAPKIPPIAEDNVAPQIPATTAGAKSAIFINILLSVFKSSGSTE